MLRTWCRRSALIGAIIATTVLSACSTGSEPATFDESYAADRLVIDDFIGTLTIETTPAGGDVELHVDATRAQLDLLPIAFEGGVLTVAWEGEPDRHRRWYEFWRGRWMADLNALHRYPTLILSVPADVEIEIDNLIGHWDIADRDAHVRVGVERGSGTIGAAPSAEIDVAGDADLEIGPVGNRLVVHVAGSGTLMATSAGEAEISVAGSGDVAIGAVTGLLSMSVSGSGEVTAEAADRVEASVSGSGAIRLGAVDGGLAVAVQGSGSVSADRVNGPFEASISGSGGVNIADGRGSPFDVTIAGSGGVRFGGTAVDPIVRISGSGGVTLGAVEGDLDATTAGTGNVQVLR